LNWVLANKVLADNENQRGPKSDTQEALIYDALFVPWGAERWSSCSGRKEIHMNTTRIMAIAALIATTGLSLHMAQAQQVGARRIDLQRHDLSVPGREVIQTIVELAPGTTAPRHTHPGEEIIYVLEGTWEYTVEGKPAVTLKAGDVLFIPAGTIHSARNVGSGRAAELATYIVEKGKPLVTVVQ
jgi:quercetin dioxygenase-like cupin family protein